LITFYAIKPRFNEYEISQQRTSY